MSENEHDIGSEIEELLGLLSCDELGPQELAEAAAYVGDAPQNPEFEWLEEPGDAMAFAICEKLEAFLVDSDKLDEFHEQVKALFADPFPSFPHDDEDIGESSFAYFRWLDGVLAECDTTEEGGYAMASIQYDLDENVRVFIVRRRDMPRILELAQRLELQVFHEEGDESVLQGFDG